MDRRNRLLLTTLLMFGLSNLTIAEEFTKGSTTFNPVSHNKPYGYSLSDDFVKAGNFSQRFEVRHGDCGGTSDWNDCKTDRRRIERYVETTRAEKAGKVVWYSWSIYVPEDFRPVFPATTTFGQVKLKGGRLPIWQIWQMRPPRAKWIGLRASASHTNPENDCKLIHKSEFLGRWTDILIKADYSTKKEPNKKYLQAWVNGEMADCDFSTPILTDEIIRIRDKKMDPRGEVNFRYGIYNAYISRWLNKHKTKEVKLKKWKDEYQGEGMVVRSPTNEPFLHDWGVKLPTQVVYYDEVRIGATKAEVVSKANQPVD